MASDRVRYLLHVVLNTGNCTPIAWNSKWHGRASAKNVKRWVESFEASTKPGGANAHLGPRTVMSATLEDTFCATTLATYLVTCRFCSERVVPVRHRTCGAGECLSKLLAEAKGAA